MKSRSFNPLRLDVAAFAQAGGELSGRWSLAELPRLAAGCLTLSDAPAPEVSWQVSGEERRVDGDMQTWLRVLAQAALPLTCQRCLGPVQEELSLDRWLRFVATEEQAAELDAEAEDDVLVLSRAFDLRWLIEDELILALPLVPRHADCRPPADPAAEVAGQSDGGSNPEPRKPVSASPPGEAERPAADGEGEPRQRPFAGLADLMKRPPGSKPRG